jgi:hypothetical protein
MSHKGSNGPAAPIVTPVEQAQAQAIVNATPTVQAYFAKHKSYAKLKLPATTGVTVASATPSTFCLESAGPLPHIFKNGPTGPLMIGTCANTAGGTPYTN